MAHDMPNAFVEILAKATALLGSLAEAERWLQRPAVGPDDQRPLRFHLKKYIRIM